MGKALSPEELIIRSITEKVWQQQVRKTLTLFGFDLIYCTWNSLHSPKGFPDLVATRERHGRWDLLFVELKRETGKASPEQLRWLEALCTIAALVNRAGCGVRIITDLWRPSDAERITELLMDGGEE